MGVELRSLLRIFSLVCVILLLVSQGAATFFSDDFEDDSDGSVPNGWDRSNDGSGGEVAADTSRSSSGAVSVRSNQPDTGSPSHWEFWNDNFSPARGYNLTFDYYLDGKTNTGSVDRFQIHNTASGNDNTGKTSFGLNFANDNGITALDGNSETKLTSRITGRWVDVSVFVNFKADEYTVQLDGTEYGPFDSPDGGNHSDFNVLWHGNDNHLGYIDNFKASAVTVPPINSSSNPAAPPGAFWIEGANLHWTNGSREYFTKEAIKAKSVREFFDDESNGDTPSSISGFAAGSECGTCQVSNDRAESGSLSFEQNINAGDDYQDALIKDFSGDPLTGTVVVEGEYWESSANHDGNFWVQACDGTNLAGIGTENPQFEAVTANGGQVVRNGGHDYQEWAHVEMKLDLDAGTVDFYWNQQGDKLDRNGYSIPTGKKICKFGVGPDDIWYVDSIEIYEGNTKGLKARYRMDSGSGQIAKDSATTKNGVLGGSTSSESSDPTWTSGRFDDALSFDGSDDRVDLPENMFDFMTTGDFTVSFWMKTTSSSRGTIFYPNGNADTRFEFDRNGNNKANFQIFSGDGAQVVSSNSQVNDGNWYHVVGTYNANSNEMKLFLDGSSQGKASDDNPRSVSRDNAIGYDAANNNRHFNGEVDEVRIFDRALSKQEIQQLYQGEGSRVGGPVGSTWVEGSGLHWIDQNGFERAFGGVDTGNSPSGASLGSTWLEDSSLTYIDNSGSERILAP